MITSLPDWWYDIKNQTWVNRWNDITIDNPIAIEHTDHDDPKIVNNNLNAIAKHMLAKEKKQ